MTKNSSRNKEKSTTRTNDYNQFLPFSSNLREIELLKVFQANRTSKQAVIAMLLSDTTDFKLKLIPLKRQRIFILLSSP